MPASVLFGFEILGTLAGVAYVVLAARRNRLCWIAGAFSSALVALLSALSGLPMQAGLNVFYVLMALYGWWAWTRSAADGELPVGTWPPAGHAAVALGLLAVTWLSARVLATETHAAWPLLDSLTTWFSLFATWLTARAKLENWLYWIVIDGVLVFLYYVQDHPLVALLNVLYVVIAAAGFVSWRRRSRTQRVPA